MRIAFVRVISVFDFKFNMQITPVFRKSPRNVASTAKKGEIIGLIMNSNFIVIHYQLLNKSCYVPYPFLILYLLPLLILSVYIVDSNFQP